MAGRDFSKRKIDEWFTGVGEAQNPEVSPESTDCVSEAVVAEGGNAVATGESSKGKKKQRKKRKAANAENWPSKVATRKLHEVALDFLELYSISQLNTTYISRGAQGVDAIKAKFHHMFWTTMSGDEWLEDRSKESFGRWLDAQVQTCIFNLAQVAEKIKGFQRSVAPRQQALNLLHKKVYWWHDAMRPLSSHNVRSAPWFQRSQNLAFGQVAAGGVVFLDRGVVVVPLSGHTKQGGNGRVRKVCLQNSKHIPEKMELAGKSALHIDQLKKAREKLSIEALVCPCDHPGVIKFFAINDMTMECYSQWWNGGTLGAMFTLDEKNRDPDEIGELAYHATPQTMEEVKRLMAYRRKRTELAWALICIVDAVQQCSVLHNDITPENIMLHFPNDDGRTVWIGLCDWGMGSRINEETPSLYQFNCPRKLKATQAKRWWVAPELMYFTGETGTSSSPSRMVRPPCVSIHTDGFSIGKLAMKVWKKDRGNVEMIPDHTTFGTFQATLGDLCKVEPLQRRSVTHAVQRLSGAPTFWTPPVDCYREARKEQELEDQQAGNED
jgi:Protein kinase domain